MNNYNLTEKQLTMDDQNDIYLKDNGAELDADILVTAALSRRIQSQSIKG